MNFQLFKIWSAGTCPFYYPQLCGEFRPIPKGLRPLAQGCEARATLGGVPESGPTPTGLRRAPHDDATPLGLIPIPCGFPKVARASQPWALSRNPIGIRFLDARKLWVIERTRHRTPKTRRRAAGAVGAAPEARVFASKACLPLGDLSPSECLRSGRRKLSIASSARTASARTASLPPAPVQSSRGGIDCA